LEQAITQTDKNAHLKSKPSTRQAITCDLVTNCLALFYLTERKLRNRKGIAYSKNRRLIQVYTHRHLIQQLSHKHILI